MSKELTARSDGESRPDLPPHNDDQPRAITVQCHHHAPDGFTLKDVISVVVMPLLLFGLTVLFANVIADRLQERSFRRSELFKARLQRIIDAQNDARRLRRDVDEAFRMMRSREEYARAQITETAEELRTATRSDYYKQIVISPALQVLRRSTFELDALAEDLGGPSGSPITLATTKYSEAVASFAGCWNTNTSLEQPCAQLHSDLVDKIQAVVVAYGRRADNFINEQEKP